MPHTFYVNKAALPKKAIENNRKNECRTAKKGKQEKNSETQINTCFNPFIDLNIIQVQVIE